MLSDGFGLLRWWQDADVVTNGVFAYLLVCVVMTWSVVVFFTLRLRRLERLEFRLRRNDRTLTPAQLQSIVSFRLVRHCREGGRERSGQGFERRLFAALHRQRVAWQSFPIGVAAIGCLAPVVGVFGSVWIMLSSLQEMRVVDQGVSWESLLLTIVVSLIPTVTSLLVTVPAMIGYRLLRERSQRLISLVESNVRRLCQRLRGRDQGASLGAAA